jgi:predicted nucleic acid-binding protein
MIVLIDTNILLDHLQQRQPHDAAATRLWKLAEERKLAAYVSAISFNNVFYIARKQAGNEKALDTVRLIRRTFQFVPLDETVMDRAIARSTADFEDAIQAAAAERAGADYIVTRNEADFRSLGVTCVTAEELLALVQPSGG